MAAELGVETIVLGEIRNLKRVATDPFAQQTQILATIRVVDPNDGVVRGVVSHEDSGIEDVEQLIRKLMFEMVDVMPLLSNVEASTK